MCLIIETQKDIHIPKNVMDDMYLRNNDGYGFMYKRNGHIVGEKYQGKNIDELYNKYEELREYEPYIHLRMKTHGDINEEQAHPFYCGHGIWMMHNGILSETCGTDTSKSDTWYFANEYLKPIFDNVKDPDQFVALPAFQFLINRLLGHSNRVVIMGPKAGAWRFNAQQWHTIDNPDTKCVGMRVSNTYAWNMWSKTWGKPTPVTHYSQKYSQPARSRVTPDGKIITPPGGGKNPSHPGDPAGSFRDDNDELWVFNGSGWLSWKAYQACFPNAKPTIYTTFTNPTASEVPSVNPTQGASLKTEGSVSQKSGTAHITKQPSVPIAQVETKKVPSFIDAEYTVNDDEEVDEEQKKYSLDVYQDWLHDEWAELTYAEVRRRVIEEPTEATDLIAFCLGIELDQFDGI